jgi:RHS repeat-associated protein
VTDAQNTPRRLIDSSNNAVVWAWDSTAFGVAPPSVQTVKFNLRFPGQYYDEITKQHYNLNRYYNPEIGRYMEPDPIGLEGGLNPYAYAGSNPVNNVDPSGLEWDALNYAPSNPLNNLTFNPIPADIYYGGGSQYYTNSGLSCTPQIQARIYSGAVTPSYPEFAVMGAVGGARAVATGVGYFTGAATTSLYRAVGPAELASINSTKSFTNIAGLEGKYFTTTQQHATNYAQMAEKAFGDPAYTIVKTNVPNKILNLPGISATVDGGIPAYVIPTQYLPGLLPKVIKKP